MNALAASVTTAIVLVHALVGCCWHHGHIHGTGDSAAQVHAECHPEHDHHAHHDGDSEQPAPHCDEVSCSFVTAKEIAPPALLIAPLDAQTLEPASASLHRGWACTAGRSRAAPPLRLHLELQKLLI